MQFAVDVETIDAIEVQIYTNKITIEDACKNVPILYPNGYLIKKISAEKRSKSCLKATDENCHQEKAGPFLKK